MDIKIILLTAVSLAALGGCTQHHAIPSPENPSHKFYGHHVESGEEVNHQNPGDLVFASDRNCEGADSSYRAVHYRSDQPMLLAESINSAGSGYQLFNKDLPLSTGDMIDLQIEDGEGYSGRYVITPDGTIQLPYLPPIKLAGLGVSDSESKIEMALVRAEIFRPLTARASVRVLHWAPIEVSVSGAVFQPGRVLINQNNQESVIAEKVNAFGDNANRRDVSEALRAASGIRPDAQLNKVILIRNGWQVELDLSGIINGNPSRNIALASGDQIIVPTTGCFQSELVRPSQITPKGFRVFMSNLINPSFDNAGAAIGRYSSNLPYGTRLLQAAVSANCVGGTQMTNAPRKVVLASKNPITKETQVIERSVEQLMRFANREDMNPYLMPNDALACYDSDVTNLRDIARSVTEIFSPWKFLF